MEEKKSSEIILVFYIDIGNREEVDVTLFMDRIKRELTVIDYNCLQFFIPIRNQDTRIECIKPVLVSEKEYEKARKSLIKVEEEMNRILFELKENRYD